MRYWLIIRCKPFVHSQGRGCLRVYCFCVISGTCLDEMLHRYYIVLLFLTELEFLKMMRQNNRRLAYDFYFLLKFFFCKSTSLFFVKFLKVWFDELKCIRLLANSSNFFISCVWFAIKNILFNCLVEQNWLLHNITYLSSQSLNVYLTNLAIIN